VTKSGAVSAPMRRSRRWLGRAAVLGAAAVILAGCTAARNDLGTQNSGCYVTLPAAVRAVHGAGHLAGVRLEAVKALRRPVPRLYAVATAAGLHVEQVCLVAFHGHFESGKVERPRGAPSGRLAVVVLEYPDSRLLGTLLYAHPPVRFGHPHLGLG
jgi:peptidoglycan/LPS O-acetylase OafA/YrhL